MPLTRVMHEEARLKSPFPAAAKFVDELVSISLVEKYFKTSRDANNVLTFVCADCDVPVSAVIIEPFKVGRKITPSSSFRRRDPNRPHTCKREPVPDGSTRVSAGEGRIPANPNRDMWPTRWVDPLAPVPSSVAGGLAAGPLSGASSGAGGRVRSSAGTGSSVAESRTIERFARAWIGMTVAQRKAKSMEAPWNSGKSLFTAFHVLNYDPDVSHADTKIFVGTAQTVVGSPQGYEVVLKEREGNGPRLSIWIPSSTLALGASGRSLDQRLFNLSNAPASPTSVWVYALGKFEAKAAAVPVRHLEVRHPHMIWLA